VGSIVQSPLESFMVLFIVLKYHVILNLCFAFSTINYNYFMPKEM